MKHPRSNFAAISIGATAYVFGGISGNDLVTTHAPLLVEDVIERYIAKDNKWEVVEIQNAP